jgi:hypothetical protein
VYRMGGMQGRRAAAPPVNRRPYFDATLPWSLPK